MADVEVVVDRDRCTGLGMCESVVPDVFEVGEDGHLVLLASSVDAARRAELEDAVSACPTQALRLVH